MYAPPARDGVQKVKSTKRKRDDGVAKSIENEAYDISSGLAKIFHASAASKTQRSEASMNMTAAHVRKVNAEARAIELKSMESRITFLSNRLNQITDTESDQYKSLKQRLIKAEAKYDEMM